jgi:hypothetical protein
MNPYNRRLLLLVSMSTQSLENRAAAFSQITKNLVNRTWLLLVRIRNQLRIELQHSLRFYIQNPFNRTIQLYTIASENYKRNHLRTKLQLFRYRIELQHSRNSRSNTEFYRTDPLNKFNLI